MIQSHTRHDHSYHIWTGDLPCSAWCIHKTYHVTSQLTRNFLSRAAGLISAGPRLGLAQAVSARAHTQTETHGTSTARATRAHVTTFSFTTRASSIVVRNHRLTRRHVARHAHLPMRPSLPPACTSCCRLLHPKGPRPHTLRTFINGFALWKRSFVVTPSTTLPRPSAGCALDDATMDGSMGGMGPAPNTAPKASPPAAKATPKPSAACYEATELAIRLA